MKQRDILKAVVVIVLGACVLSGCWLGPKLTPQQQAEKSIGELRAAIRATIKDPVRAEEAVVAVGKLQRLSEEAVADLKAHNARLRELNANYDATEGEFRVLFDDLNQKRNGRQARLLAVRQRLQELTTPEEWSELLEARAEALEDSLKALQQVE